MKAGRCNNASSPHSQAAEALKSLAQSGALLIREKPCLLFLWLNGRNRGGARSLGKRRGLGSEAG